MDILLIFFYYQLYAVGLLVTSIYRRTVDVLKTLLRVEQPFKVKIVYIFLKAIVGSISK